MVYIGIRIELPGGQRLTNELSIRDFFTTVLTHSSLCQNSFRAPRTLNFISDFGLQRRDSCTFWICQRSRNKGFFMTCRTHAGSATPTPNGIYKTRNYVAQPQHKLYPSTTLHFWRSSFVTTGRAVKHSFLVHIYLLFCCLTSEFTGLRDLSRSPVE